MELLSLTATHWPQVRAIYEQGLATGQATFQTKAPSWQEWDRSHLTHSRLVTTDDAAQVLGWVALSPV